MKNNYIFYYIFANILKFIGHLLFLDKVEGKENIPKDGAVILAGNHTSAFDPYLLFRGTNRPIHFIAKKELFDSPLGWFFKKMHLIPVNRKEKNEEAKKITLELLSKNQVVAIFPEGTYHDKNSKTKSELLLPFKPGVVSFASKSNASIIPFAITGKYRLFSRPKIVFGKPIYINNISDNKLEYLEKIIKDMLIK